MKKKCVYLMVMITLLILSNVHAALPVTSGLVMDLDADTITGVSDGAPISTWSDQSGAGNDATQGTADNQPVYIASNPEYAGHATVRFDGTNDWMTLPSTTCNVGSFTMFAVANYAIIEESHNMYICAGQDGGGNDRIRFQLDTTDLPDADAWFEWRAGSSSWKGITYTPADTLIHVFGETSAVEGFLDGVSVGTSANTSTENPTAFNIGSYNRGQKDFFAGDLAQLVIYNRVLTPGEIAAVSDYLETKWSSAALEAVYPENGQSNVELDATLEWNGLEDPNNPGLLDPSVMKHYIWMDMDNMDTDANMVNVATVNVSDWSSRAASYGPLSLSLDQSVSWQIEEGLDDGAGGVYAAGDPNNVLGPVWSFTVLKSVPVVSQDQPVSVRVFPAESAVFNVDFSSTSTPTVKWYKNDNTTVTEVLSGITTTNNGGGSYTTTLTLASVAASDEGQYYCSVTNDDLNWYDSGIANLIINRQLANYTFDSAALTDSSGNSAPAGTAMDSLGDPNTATHVAGAVSPVDGADGTINGALYLDPNEYINFTVDGYPKASPVTSNGFGGGLDEGTIIVWVKPVNDWSQTILGGFNDGSASAFQAQLQSDGDFRIYIRAESGGGFLEDEGRPDRPEYDLNDGSWHMMAACWSGNEVSIYVDGQSTGSETNSTPTSFGPWQYDVLLGTARPSSDRSFLTDTFDGGAIDNLRIYNYRLDVDGTEVFAQEYLDNTGVLPCTNLSYLDGFAAVNLDDTGSSYCKVDLADFALFAEAWLVNGLYDAP